MPESTDAQLEQKRFVINPESMVAMKQVRDALPKLKAEYPFLMGVSFFGSRTKGKEREGSDLDIRIFYDSDKSLELSNTFNGLLPAVPHVSREKKAQLQGSIRVISGLNLDQHDGLLVDISRERTDKYLELFTDYVKQFIENNTVDDNIQDLAAIPPAQNLYGQFFLAVGEGVYKNRAYVMDRFRSMPQGEQYFQVLMKCMSSFERGGTKHPVPEYKRLPQTIDEAQRYFLTRQDVSDPQLTSKAA